MSQLRFLLCLFSGFLLLSCNKGEFNPTQCDDCPELMSCYDGVCDCDRENSLKIWNNCFEKLNRRSFYYTADTGFGLSILILDSLGFEISNGKYKYNMYTGEVMYGPFKIDGKKSSFTVNARIHPQGSSDSVYFMPEWPYSLWNGSLIHRYMYGVRYGIDSMELQVVHVNIQTWDGDTLGKKMFYRYE